MTKGLLANFFTFLLLVPQNVLAYQSPLEGLRQAGSNTALIQDTDPTAIIVRIINGVLTLLGSIFLALMVYGGFKWMTSRGNSQAVDEAKKVIGNAVIGLGIVAAAYAITWTVVELLSRNTGAGGSSIGGGGLN